MDHLSNWVAGGAILGLLTACWGHIKNIGWKIASTLIQRAELGDGGVHVLNHMLRNYKMSSVYDKTYDTNTTYLYNDTHKDLIYGHVPFEHLGGKMLIFWNGWFPILFNTTQKTEKKNDNNGSSPAQAATVSVTYLRGTWNLDKVYGLAVNEYNESGWNWELINNRKISRFCVWHIPSFDDDGSEKKAGNGKQTIMSTNLPWWQQDSNRILHYTRDKIGFARSEDNKALDRLIFPDNVMGAIQEIKLWRDNREWYKKKGIPWKRGWLLYGVPGSGKTSLVRAFAEDLDMPVFVYNLSELGNFGFQKHWLNMQSSAPCIALIEDIDNVFHGRVNVANRMPGMMSMMARHRMKKKKPVVIPFGAPETKNDDSEHNFDDEEFSYGGLTFDVLLNMLDGIDRSEGIFTVITTNHIDQIDEALGRPQIDNVGNQTFVSTRPGRIDRAIELKHMQPGHKKIMAQRILSEYNKELSELLVAVDREGEEVKETPAQFQDRCTQIALKCFWEEQNKKKEEIREPNVGIKALANITLE